MKTYNILALFARVSRSDNQVTSHEIISLANNFLALFGDVTWLNISQDLVNLNSDSRSTAAIAAAVRAEVTDDEAAGILLSLYVLAYADGITAAELECLEVISAAFSVPGVPVHQVPHLFTGSLHAFQSNPTVLTFGGLGSGADVPLSGYNGRCAVFSSPSQRWVVAPDSRQILLSGTPVRTNAVFRVTEQATLAFSGTRFLFTQKQVDTLLHKKNNPAPHTLTLSVRTDVPGGQARKKETLFTLQHSANQVVVHAIDHSQTLLLSGIPAPQPLPLTFFDGEVISFEGSDETFIIANEHGTHGSQHSEEHLHLHRYSSLFSEHAILHVVADADEAVVSASGITEPIYRNGQAAGTSFVVVDEDTIRVGNLTIHVDLHTTITLTVRPITVSSIEVNNLQVHFPGSTAVALDTVSCRFSCATVTAIVGPAGSGKSTFLKALIGAIPAAAGGISINGQPVPRGLRQLHHNLGYVPQDDVLCTELTVWQNLSYRAQLHQAPASRHEHTAALTTILELVGLKHKAHSRVGDHTQNFLSGGERKRLNIALELTANPEVLILDEPTSGLSSYDAELIITALRRLARTGKIIILVIHQPSSLIYRMFDQVIILNRGGQLAFAGERLRALELFSDVSQEQDAQVGVECPTCHTLKPDVLMKSLSVEARPYWDLVRTFNTLLPAGDDLAATVPAATSGAAAGHPSSHGITTLPPHRRWSRFLVQARRSFARKLRDRVNLLVTFCMAPVLGISSALVLRTVATGAAHYSFPDNPMYPSFLFVAVIAGLFFGVTNSIGDIINDRAILKRESLLGLPLSSYYLARFCVLIPFALVQAVIFMIPAHLVLGEPHMVLVNIAVMTLVTLPAIALGLFISIFVSSATAAYNLIPLLFILFILFSGVFPRYSEINRGLFMWRTDTERGVPPVADCMPSRWGFELAVCANIEFHPYNQVRWQYNRALEAHARQCTTVSISPEADAQIIQGLTATYDARKNEAERSFNRAIRSADMPDGGYCSPVNLTFSFLPEGSPLRSALKNTWLRDSLVLVCMVLVLLAAGYTTLCNTKHKH